MPVGRKTVLLASYTPDSLRFRERWESLSVDLRGLVIMRAWQSLAKAARARDLLNAGMAYMNTTSQGGTPLQGLVNALVSSSALGNSAPHRNQSSSLVVNSLLSALGGMLKK